MIANPSIIIVEDEDLIQAMLACEFEDGGFTVAQATNVEQAIFLLDRPGAEYRALVTDIRLGHAGMAGWDVARHAREINPRTPVVYIGGDSECDWAARGVPNSIMIPKPFVPAQVLSAISRLMSPRTTRGPGWMTRPIGMNPV